MSRSMVVVGLVVVAVAGLAYAGEAKPFPPPIAETLATKVSEAYGVTVGAKDLDAGLPAMLVKPIEGRYVNAKKDSVLADWRKEVAVFETAWSAYVARHDEVAAAIAKAEEQKATPDEAKKTLLAVIAPNGDGKADKRKLLEPRDAEVDAIVALAKLYAAQKDFVAAASIPPMLQGRRHVGPQEDERLLWLADQKSQDLRFLSSQQKDPQKEPVMVALRELLGRTQRALNEPRETGRSMLKALPSLGPKFVELWDATGIKKGDWVFFRVSPTKLDDKGLTFSDHGTYQVNVACHEGSKIIGWNPVSSTWIWNTECSTKNVTENIDLKVQLAQPPQAWAKSQFGGIWVIGKVAQVGPKWSLTNAGVADWRFLGVLGM